MPHPGQGLGLRLAQLPGAIFEHIAEQQFDRGQSQVQVLKFQAQVRPQIRQQQCRQQAGKLSPDP